jgi:hypothetical protein
MKVIIYWERRTTPKNHATICRHLGISKSMSINRETDVEINDEQYKTLLRGQSEGFIQIRNKHGTE